LIFDEENFAVVGRFIADITAGMIVLLILQRLMLLAVDECEREQ
jgi:hypothetical protein